MTDMKDKFPSTPKSEFENQASEKGLIGEFIEFLGNTGKFWLIPLLVILGLIGVLVVLGQTGAAPFIYTLF